MGTSVSLSVKYVTEQSKMTEKTVSVAQEIEYSLILKRFLVA